jgi:hypothetical protein
MVDYHEFAKWLCESVGLGERSTKDVISRLRRVKKFVDYEKHRGLRSTLYALEGNEDFKNLSVFVRSQLKRALTLYYNFKG